MTPCPRSASRTCATASRTPISRGSSPTDGRAALLAILARRRIFSIRGNRLLLGCTSGCDLATTTKYSWPRYRHDAGTDAALERVHTALLEALAPVPAS